MEGTTESMAQLWEGADKFAAIPKLKPRPSGAQSRGLHQDRALVADRGPGSSLTLARVINLYRH
ncbi:MAG: hypothetical protein CMH90_07685 [Oceanicaulis sp.]|nr:hypothetical protein [Oceanicaulis sp.]